MEPNNELLATQTLTLRDGLARTFCWNYGAVILMEDASRADKADGLGMTSSRTLRNMIWAGLHQDALDRGEKWTRKKVEELLPFTAKEITALNIEVSRLVEQATKSSGENVPAVASAKGAPAQMRGHGGKRRKR